VSKDNGDCKKCHGLCCRYFGLPIETPETKADFDDIRWYLVHKGTEVYVSDDDWYLNVKNTCKHLKADYGCAIYDTRPRICRQYATTKCDITSDEYDHEHHFYSATQLEEYAQGYLRDKRRLAQLRGKHRRAKKK
jgi:Fe-S-cluster containining protein